MDEEDLADAEEARKIQTSDAFAGLGNTDGQIAPARGLSGLLHVKGETMGVKLLKKMGWREGQGIGPKIRRTADLGMASRPDANDTHLFAPGDVPMISFSRKENRKGLRHSGEQRLAPLASSKSRSISANADEDVDETEDGFKQRQAASTWKSSFSSTVKTKHGAGVAGGIGLGVLNDTGSDDEDPYEIGPRIAYNRALGANSKSKKKKAKEANSATLTNPSLRSRPVFLPKKPGTLLGSRKCHDGRPPLAGYVLAQNLDFLTSIHGAGDKYPPPIVPKDWKSRKQPEVVQSTPQQVSAADAAKASRLDPAGRAALLGEKQLPGKSVFDFLSQAARDRLVAATGKGDLPQAGGEIPKEYALSEDEKRRNLLDRIPKLDKQSALAAIARGASGGGPYGDNEEKRARYRSYLELQAGLRSDPPDRPGKMTKEEWLQEMDEFHGVGRIFRPMTGSMASRFTTSSTSSSTASISGGKAGDTGLLTAPTRKPEDPTDSAAKLGMFGHMTRSVKDFYPSRLLCKRFNVKPPSHVQAEVEAKVESVRKFEPSSMLETGVGRSRNSDDAQEEAPAARQTAGDGNKQVKATLMDTDKNEALEGRRAGEEVFKAIFGDSSDEDS